MMSNNESQLASSNAGFALAAAITVIFNTFLACVKDAYHPLLLAMNAVGYHNWITQGVLDLSLFFALGFVFSKSGFVARMPGRRVSVLVVWAVVLAGGALFLWYALF